MDTTENYVILVNKDGKEIGTMEKMEAHEKGLLHRAFSVIIFNEKGEMLIHQRALDKYHSGGLWTNACCSHPRPKEQTIDGAQRRLQEEMGFTTELSFKFSFTYNTKLDNNLSEHEYDYVYYGKYEDIPPFNTNEVMACKFVDVSELKKDVKQNPENYTVWFRLILDKVQSYQA